MSIKFSFGKSPNNSKISSLLGGLICLALSLIGFYVALFGGEISGGIPFVPDNANTLIGRILFGFGALLTGSLAIYAFRELFQKKETTS